MNNKESEIKNIFDGNINKNLIFIEYEKFKIDAFMHRKNLEILR